MLKKQSIDSKYKKVRKAVLPVAGLGTRFLPATKVMPKEMLPLVDKPLIQNAVEEAFESGIEEIIFVSAAGKETLESHFKEQPVLNDLLRLSGKTGFLNQILATDLPSGTIKVAIQEKALGFGHAVWCARDLVGDEPFAIILPDDVVLADTPCLKQMISVYEEKGGNIVAVEDVPREHTQRYGILDVESDDGKLAIVRGLVEKPRPEDAPSTLSIIGRYILQPEVFSYLGRMEKGAGGEIQLTDSMAKLIERQPFHGLRFSGRRFDCGNKVGFLEANIAYALQRPEMKEAVRAAITRQMKEMI